MLIEELESLVKKVQALKSESNQIELKAARQGAPKIYDTLSSFSNQTGGGIILFGIDEQSNYQLCGVYDAADLQKKVSEQCLQMDPPVRALCTATKVDGKAVVSAEIQEIEMARRPCYYKGKGPNQGSYIRVGDADRKMTEYEVYSYEAYRKKIQDELRIVDRATQADIQTRYLDDYLVRLSVAKPNLAALSKERQLRLQGFCINGAPTLAGIELFSDYPQSFFPRLCITAVVVPGTEMGDTADNGARFIDNTTIEGTLPQMLAGALSFVRRNMSVQTIIDRDTGERKDRTEYPVMAVREILLNALIHRDYSIHTETAPITVVMYRNRMVVENPGGLYGRLTIDTLGTVSADTRNPFIAGAMEIENETENRFSGIPTIRKEMKAYHLPEPVFENERGTFRVILYNSALDIKEKPTRSLEEAILHFCCQPRTREDLAQEFSHITKTYLMTGYVNPLVERGMLLLSLPDKPRSRHQQFTTRTL